MKSPIPYSKQSIDKDDIESVMKVLRGDWITQGPTIAKFETAISTFVNSKFAVATSSGTAALHAACFAAGVSKGDEVIVPTLSFVASANCVAYQGATPKLVDIDLKSGNIDIDQIKKNITKKTKAIIGVDFAGNPAKWDEIAKIAKDHNLITIDDAAHAIGSKYKNRMIGTIADLTIFSFHPVKTITTGEGGMVTTNNKDYFQKLLIFRHHGIVKIPSQGDWYYELRYLGNNYRMTDIQAALGLSQLKKIRQFIAKRRRIVNIYNKSFKNLASLTLPIEEKFVTSAWHLYPLRFDLKKLKMKKIELFKKLRDIGLGVQVHYIPIHLHSYYQENFGYRRGDFKNAEKFYEEEISIPLFPSMTKNDIEYVIKSIKSLAVSK